jgi:hypothetical protein
MSIQNERKLKKRKAPVVPELFIKRQILSYLGMHRDLMVIHHDSVGIYNEKRGRFLKRHQSNFGSVWYTGVSDILVWSPDFGFWAVEVKSKVGRLSPNQKLFLTQVKLLGGMASVARSLEDVQTVLSVLRQRKVRRQSDT